MRNSCLFCVCKHLSQAQVLYMESFKGYPLHKWLAIGHLAEAEDESLDKFPDLMDCIRGIRLRMMCQEEGEVQAGEIIRCLGLGIHLLEESRQENEQDTQKKKGKK